MALLTIPSTPEKGVPQTYTLNVTDLIALISDPYFQQQTNWSKVVVMYQSSVSNQIEGITFTPDGVSTSLEADGTFSLEARDIFNVQSISVIDKQNGRNIIYAASIPDVANYEVDFAVAPLGASTFFFDPALKSSSIDLTAGERIATGNSAASGAAVFITPVYPYTSPDKIYLEVQLGVISGDSRSAVLGAMVKIAAPTLFSYPVYPFDINVNGGWAFLPSGSFFMNGAYIGPAITFSSNDLLMMAIDISSNLLWFGKNGVWNNGNPSLGTGGSNVSGNWPLNHPLRLGMLLEGSSAATIVTYPAYTPSGFSV